MTLVNKTKFLNEILDFLVRMLYNIRINATHQLLTTSSLTKLN